MRPLTDCGNAERLVDQHGDCMRFCATKRQWFVWNAVGWAADRGAAVQLAKKTARTISQEQVQILSRAESDNGDWNATRRQADAMAKWANRSEGAAQITAALRMAESDPRISVAPEEFDSFPWVLNLSNGTIELGPGDTPRAPTAGIAHKDTQGPNTARTRSVHDGRNSSRKFLNHTLT